MAKTILYYIAMTIACMMLVTGLSLVTSAWGQHPPHDQELHTKFYSTWLMPNGGSQRTASCCNLHDCYPTPFKLGGAQWYARRREDGVWMPIPDSKLEQLQGDPRESPDGQGHVCAPPPLSTSPNSTAVYCATLGASGI